MSQLGRAMLIYANDQDGFPDTSKWCDLLIEHAELNPGTFRCKGALQQGRCHYAMNKNVINFSKRDIPPDMVVLFETHPGWNQVGGPELLTTDNHQGEGCNILFADNHVEFVRTQNLDRLKW